MNNQKKQDPSFELVSTVIGSPDPRKLARFYVELLGFQSVIDEPDWVKIQSSSGMKALSFQYEEIYTSPVWPASLSDQQMMMHLDIGVHDMTSAVAKAQELGASIAHYQPQTEVKVMLDPDGHPFCLFSIE